MARYEEREDSAVDIESDAGSIMSSPNEDTPLLSTDLPAEIVPDKSFQRLVIGMVALFLFIIEISQYIMEPAKMAIMEDIICRNQFPDHSLSMPSVQDHRCKDKEVQKTLAMVRSWIATSEMFFPLFVQVPFGIIADKYGRRPVLFTSIFGIVLSTTWTMVVLLFPDVLSIWAMVWGSVACLIGGGGPMALAMLWTLLADAIPVAERTRVFYLIRAMNLFLGVILNPIAAALLTIDPWFSMWFGYGALILGMLLTLLVPETLKLRQKADDKRRHEQAHGETTNQSSEADGVKLTKGNVARQAWFAAKNDMGHIWRFIFASKSVMSLIIAYGCYYPVKLSFSYSLLQYMAKRFDWSWSRATYVSTVGTITSLIVLLVILPTASSVLTKRYKLHTLTRDLFLTRASIAFAAVGATIVAFASAPWLFVSALVIYSIGDGFSVLCRALLSAVVEPHTLGTLNTTISTVESLMGLVSAPAVGWLFSKGLDLGGMWMGMPYMVTAALCVGVLAATFAFRIPSGLA